jgi:galactokinase/mevalonate kinase-like predicted kinase
MGAVLLSVVQRLLGRALSPTALFHGVLRLEQALTTGGGWQDQIGGSTAGLKLISTAPGLIPQAHIRHLPADVLDPRLNDGQTLLYYTGITRLAKDILEQVVGRYLDRDREAMDVLDRLKALATQMAEVIAGKDLSSFGRLLDVAWQLNKRLDPHSSNEEIESLLGRAAPHIHGAKLLGAGGGGFLLLVCKSSDDAGRLKSIFQAAPPNPRARFFEFGVSPAGLALSVC